MGTGVHVGVTVPQIKRTWPESVDAACELEAMGFDSLWVCDHLYGPQSPSIPILEAWTLLAALAARTERVELGTLVTPAGMRNPAHLGKVIATVDSIAGGRVIPGFGVGWMPREHTDFGMPFHPVGDRFDQLDETVRFLRELWDPVDGDTTFDGRFVHADHVVCLPAPPRRPPILIGGSGERRTIPLAARHADIWNNPAISQHDLSDKIDVLRVEADKADRDPSTLRISQQCLVVIGPDSASAATQIDTAARVFGGHLGDPRGELAIAGDPDRVVEQIRRHADLGCTMLIVEFFGRDIREPARLFAETVLPHLRD
jgi:alkanesulfonate monooxygenase SsuD/methylene tetrahydromethanopterin reductase-like flavin-dependent oxidoreductase (luciferase family)